MKKTAKVLVALLATLMVFASIPVFGANTGLPPTDLSFTVHKYVMADLDKQKAPNDGTDISGDPSKLPSIPDEARPIEGIVFKMYKINVPLDANGNAVTAPLDEVLSGYDVLNFSLDDYENPSSILLPPGYTTSDGTTVISSFTLSNAITMPATDSNGLSTVSNYGAGANPALTKGFYVVVEQLNDKVASIVSPFIAAVPMTNAEGDGWIKDVHVFPKNGDLGIKKYIDRNAVQLGEEVQFDVVLSVPADILEYKQFDMTDVLDNALTYTPGSLKVYGGSVSNDIWNDIDTLIDQDPYQHFTITEPASGNNNTLTAALKVSATPANDGRPSISDYKYIRYSFKCRINENILDRAHLSYTVENEAELNFKNKFDQVARTRNSNKVKAHSAAIIIDKIDAHDNSPLEGAKFKIASSEANARAGLFLKTKMINGVKTILDTNHLNYNDADAVEIELEAKKPVAADASKYDAALWSYIWGDGTNPKAVVRFEGLKEFGTLPTAAPANPGGGNPSLALPNADHEDRDDVNSANHKLSTLYHSFWMVETFTPADYNLLLEPIKVDFNSEKSKKGNWYTLGSDAGNSITVRNTNKFTLPKTGGMGTILFTAGGAALIGVAVFLFILSARRKKDKNM